MNSPFKHFVFVAGTDKPSPTGSGHEAGWLQYYKLDSDDDEDVFIPWETDASTDVPKTGDYLWMQIDKDVVAMVAVERVEEDPLNDRLELWFKGSNITTVEGVKSELTTGPVAEDTATSWLKQLPVR